MRIPQKFWLNGLNFECTRCGWCCSAPGGFVHGSEDEFRAIAEHMSLDFKTFLKKYTIDDAGYLSLASSEKGPCIFYDNGCKIYPVRPTQCRTFPFWQGLLTSEMEWQEMAGKCPGIGNGRLWRPEKIMEFYHANNLPYYKTPDWLRFYFRQQVVARQLEESKI
ncbi:YkgJ family cysteine cluster protein [bacterium]|nr:YkgJ family cysteine cluster protein [bacterium]